VDIKEIMISSLDKLECVDKLCYFEDLVGAKKRVEEARRGFSQSKRRGPVYLQCLWISE